jgi:hypothetical protein
MIERRRPMKRLALPILALGVLAFAVLPACKTMSSEELKSSIEVLDYTSAWVSKYYQPWPPRLILVPQISFRIKNIGAKPLAYVNFNAIYQFKGDPENFGDSFKAAIRGKAVPPGGTSDVIVLKSNLGVEGKNLAGIRGNPMWKQAFVRLFAISRGSHPVLLGVYDVSRDIDFKEPEPVEPKK